MKKLIIFTGGHHNSTLEIAKASQKEGFNVLWLGHKFNSGDNKSLSGEFLEVTEAKIQFLELKTGRFYKKINLFEGFKIIFGFFQSIYYLLKFKPSLIFSSGGYMAVPVVIVGWVLGIPSITHEQTVISGWANKAVAPFVKKILLTHDSSLSNYPQEKSLVVGMPVRKELLDKNNSKVFHPKLLFITCGKQGSHTVNNAIFPLIPLLVKKFTIIHQVGANVLTKDIERARRLKEKLGKDSSKYLYAPYFIGKDSASFLRSADLVISRAGAHTIYELILLNKKAIVIPISWVSHSEQELNAKLASEKVGSIVLSEKNLSSETLLEAITKSNKLPKQKLPAKLENDVTEKIIEIIKKELS
jgi:UDP-N-acetylglucosamine--N-acetylmuramyl-(pentapeptide) pyrophosphoryl-undecaprenol N-acetylglucosamine transferase